MMEKRIQFNPSIATILDIGPIGVSEVVPIFFRASEPWPGNYTVTVWNSEKKNTELFASPVVKEEDLLTWEINPEADSIAAGENYFEIIDLNANRIVFEGCLKIEK